MNQKLHFAMSFYALGLSVRDTLEYIQNRNQYNVLVHSSKSAFIANALNEGSPFDNFCKNNGEIGEKLKDQLKELNTLVYGPSPRFLRIEGENIVVDHSQNIKVLDLIIPLKVSLFNICQAYFNTLAPEEVEQPVIDLVNLENEYYSVVISFVLSEYIFLDRFDKFNQEMREHKGQQSVESNFTLSEINKLVSMYNYIKQQTGSKYELFNKLDGEFQRGLDIITGKQVLPQGTDIKTLLTEIPAAYLKELKVLEEKYKNAHALIWKELHEFEMAAQEAAKKATQN